MKSIQALDYEIKVLIEKNFDIEIPIFIRIPTVNFAVGIFNCYCLYLFTF